MPQGARRLGRSGLAAGPIAYGCWRFAGTGVAEAREKIEAALDAGMTLVDTADIYGEAAEPPRSETESSGGGPPRERDGAAEALLGRVLADAPGLRARMVLATKGGIRSGVPYDSSADALREACEASLRRLRVDAIDLYQIHRPDLLAHPAEVAGVLAGLREAGKVREVGVSNFTPAQTDALQAHLPFPLATAQPELSAWERAPLFDGVLDQCMERGTTPLAWSPLAGGKLAMDVERARREEGGERLAALLERMDAIAKEQGVARSAVALAFVGVHPSGAIPIVGTQRPERIREAADALRVELERSQWYGLLEAARGAPMP